MSARSRIVSAIVSFCALAALSGAANADPRVALVIGNSKYQNVARLTNPAEDAKLMAQTLRDLGFTLVGGGARFDLDKKELDRAVQDFGNAAQGADVALFYYAGHGLGARGMNYLVPVDARLSKESDLDFQTLGADKVLRQMEDAHARLNLIILDACRDNPFIAAGTRGIGSGLARMEAPEGTLISFATQPGHVAFDGDGQHSPFTAALAETIRKPGLDIFRTFNEVGLTVSRATGGEQQPWLALSPIKGDFYFGGAPKAPEPPKPDPLIEVRRNYEAAERVGTKEAWTSFLNAHPKGYMADLARAQREKIITQERAQERAKATAAEETRRQAEAEAAREVSEKAAREAAAKAAALEQARKDAETKTALEAAEKARTAAAAEKAAREAQAKEAQAALEEATRQAAAAKAAEQAAEKAAQEAIATLEKERAAREQQVKTAALQPPSGDKDRSTPAVIMDSVDIVRLVKIHLQQVGCDPGSVSGIWDKSSQEALTQFNKHAGTQLDVKTVSLSTLDSLRAIDKRVCPLVCGQGTRREGDQCIAITCDRGSVLGTDGKCKPSPNPKTTTRPNNAGETNRKSPSGGIVLGSPRYEALASACGNNNMTACQTLCDAGGRGACRRLAGVSGGGHGGGHRRLENKGRVPIQ